MLDDVNRAAQPKAHGKHIGPGGGDVEAMRRLATSGPSSGTGATVGEGGNEVAHAGPTSGSGPTR